MFTCVIERWVALAAFSDNWATRQGHHTRASDWPDPLVRAEHERHRFDTLMCWATASHIADGRDRVVAFAMATHPRLGALSPALCLVGDLVRQVAGLGCVPSIETLYTNYLHAHAVPNMTVFTNPRQRMVFTGVPVSSTEVDPAASVVVRRMLKSEVENTPAQAWSNRTPFFFCRRGWFAGVTTQQAPQAAVNHAMLLGIFESVPHVFCDVWFPVCRPFSVCMHLVHVSYMEGTHVAV